MRAGWVVECAGGLAFALALATVAGATEGAGEVRVLSGPGAATIVTVRSQPEVQIEDRTPGARPAAGPRGPASAGETFTGELALFLRAFTVSRPAAIEVGDPLVSAVRMFPEPGGTLVTVFVRQPVTYTVSRPSALGEVRIELRGRTRPLTVSGERPAGRLRIVRPPKVPESREVAVDAESLSYDQQTDTLTARGGVTLTRGDTTLTADEVVYDRTNGIAEARGHVVLSDPQATVEAEFAHLNLEDESGWLEAATANLHASNYIVRGGRLVKKGGPQYGVAGGVFTTCQCGGLEKPSWSIAGKQTDVQLQGRGLARGVSFRVKDVPVLYLPYLIFPANTERQSGFLMPRVGYSNRRGFQYEQPFFWAISKSTDATLALDVESEARLGFVGEYRYLLSRQARGSFTAAYYNEQIRGSTRGTVETAGTPADIPENRFVVAGHHAQPFYGASKFYLDMLAVSDDNVLREINTLALGKREDIALRSTRFTTSRTGLYKTWTGGLAWAEAAYHQDLIEPQELTLQTLPRLEAGHALPLFGGRLVGRLAGETVDYQREDGYDGLRADLAPELFLPFHLGRALSGSLTGRVRETAYHLTDREQVALLVPDDVTERHRLRVAPELPLLDANRTRELAEVHGRTGTELARIFSFPHLGLEKLKHTIEPEVRYLFVPQVGRRTEEKRARVDGESVTVKCGRPGEPACNATLFSEGFLFDERDAINRRNFLSYGLTTRLIGRPASPPEAATREPEAHGSGAAESRPVDPETLAQGLPAAAVPEFVGPPPPPAAGAAPEPPARELARATVLHGYDLSRPLVGDSHQSDVDLGLRLTPVDYLGMAYNTTVSLEESALRGFTVGFFAREPRWVPPTLLRALQSPTTLGVSYRFIESGVNRSVARNAAEERLLRSAGLEEVDGSLYVRLGNYLGFTFLSRYDLSTSQVSGRTLGPHFLERDYLVRLISRCNCWVLEAGLADKFNPNERLFRVQFTLVGLGSFGRRPTTRNYVGFAPLTPLGFQPPVPTRAGGPS